MVRGAIRMHEVAGCGQAHGRAVYLDHDDAHVIGLVFVDVAANAHAVHGGVLIDDGVFLGVQRIQHHRIRGVRVRQSGNVMVALWVPTTARGGRQGHEQAS